MIDHEDTHTTPKIVIFDLGGVLNTTNVTLTSMADLAGRDSRRFATAYWDERDEYDLGTSPEDYWRKVLTRIDVEPSASLITSLDALDCHSWGTIDAGAVAYLNGLRSSAVRMGVLSNAPLSLAWFARNTTWSRLFDVLYFSSELSLAKPDPRIFRHVAEDLDCTSRDILFIDDRMENVIAASRAGWDAHIWQSHAHTVDTITRHGLEIRRAP